MRMEIEVEKNFIEKIIGTIMIPLVLIYYEIIFNNINKLGAAEISLMSILHIIIIGLFISFIIKAVSLFSRRASFIVTIIIFSLLSLYFMTESYIYSFFGTFMDLETIIMRFTDVCNNYMKETLYLIFSKIFIIFLFVLPIVLLIFARKYYIFPLSINDGIISLMIIFIIFVFNSFQYKDLIKEIKMHNDFYSTTYKYGLFNGMKYNLFKSNSSNKKSEFEILRKEVVASISIADKTSDGYYNSEKYNALPIDFDGNSKKYSDKSGIVGLNEFVKSIAPSKKNEYTGIFKNKNLILMCVESLSKYAINETLTPNLYRLIHNGFYFSNAYSTSTATSTTEGEYQLLLGQSPTYGTNSMFHTVENVNAYTFASLMRKTGYNTACFHNGYYHYYNRNITHENLGYEYFMALRNGLEELTNGLNSDYEMLNKTLDLYIDKKPFSIYYMTYDGHLPYTKSDKYYNIYAKDIITYYGKEMPEAIIEYEAKMMSFDKAVGNLIYKLDKKGILDDTVIAFVSDHYPYGLNQVDNNYYTFDLYGSKFNKEDFDIRDRNCIAIWSSSLEKDLKSYQKEIKVPVNSIDMLPTILNLFGIEYDSRLLIGKDVFSDSVPIITWQNRSFMTDKCFYNGITGKVKSFSEEEVSDKYVKEMLSLTDMKILFSKLIVDENYFKYLFDEDSDVELKTKDIKEESKKKNVNNVLKGTKYKNVNELIANKTNVKDVYSFTQNKVKIDSIDQYDTVLLGKYEQDNNLENGKEDLEWIVVYKDANDRVLLVSKYIIDNVKFASEDQTSLWKDSYLRSFANSEFYNTSFNELEKEKIQIINSSFDENESIFDFVNVLGLEEISFFFGERVKDALQNISIATKGTRYATKKGLFSKEVQDTWYDGNSNYWIKNMNSSKGNYHSVIEYNGYINNFGYGNFSTKIGFRPSVWISIE